MMVHPLELQDACRPLEQVTLCIPDADFLQRVALPGFLDTFCDHGQVKLVCKIGDSLNQLSAVTGYSDDELPVDLDVVERETLQQGEVTVIRAEIIDSVLHAIALEARQVRVAGGQAVEQSALC